MIVGISIYPQEMDIKDIEKYLKTASDLGFSHVFTTAHLPEYSLLDQLNYLTDISTLISNYQMKMVTDIRGSLLKQIFKDPEVKKIFDSLEIHALRIDFELDDEVFNLIGLSNIDNVYVNASTMRDYDIDRLLERAGKYKLNVRACHNFYPRPETGLGKDFFERQNNLFKKRDIAVSAFLPSFNLKRGPLKEGLVSLEKHRKLSFEEACLDMVSNYDLDEILIGDLMASEEELSVLKKIALDRTVDFRIELKDKSKEKIFKPSVKEIRYDSGSYQFRIEGTRQMASYSHMQISPNNMTERKRGDICLDNELYGRYQAELQIILKDLPRDERVNVIGHICEEDMWKLDYINNTFKLNFKLL